MRLTKPSATFEQILPREEAYKRIEKAGRVCYKSEDKITETSATKFVNMLRSKNHLTVFEHISLTARIICDRGISHQLITHRLISKSQESTRYCNYANKEHVEFIIPHWCDIEAGDYDSALTFVSDIKKTLWMKGIKHDENIYLELIYFGMSPEDARGNLPNALKTEIVITANLRQWLYMLKIRTSKHAHPDMRKIMDMLYLELKTEYPEMIKVFEDIEA